MIIHPMATSATALDLPDPDFGNTEALQTTVVTHPMVDGSISTYVRNADQHVRVYKYSWSFLRVRQIRVILNYLLLYATKTFMVTDHNGNIFYGKLVSDLRTAITMFAGPSCTEEAIDRTEAGTLELEFHTNA